MVKRQEIREVLEETRQSLEENQAELKKGHLSGGQGYLRAYAVFDDALEAAGLASALEEPEDTIRELLRVAAEAAPRIFHYSGTYTQSVTELASGEREDFADTSAANPWTLVRGLYAAVVSGARRAEHALAKLPPEAYHSDQVTVSAVADHYTRALQLVLADEVDAASEALAAAERSARHAHSEGQPQWLAQVHALQHLIDKDADAFKTDLKELTRALDAYYKDNSAGFSAEAHLKLPLRGLHAISEKLLRKG